MDNKNTEAKSAEELAEQQRKEEAAKLLELKLQQAIRDDPWIRWGRLGSHGFIIASNGTRMVYLTTWQP